ncbi:MAG: choice-of-anchor D domain-containing protein, partial [Planctomycetota bacterium]|nr:choice-of-anchor D domain-containing protein [Planctomycetota bacterium]
MKLFTRRGLSTGKTNRTKSRKSANLLPRCVRSRSLLFEPLETRTLLAANYGFGLVHGASAPGVPVGLGEAPRPVLNWELNTPQPLVGSGAATPVRLSLQTNSMQFGLPGDAVVVGHWTADVQGDWPGVTRKFIDPENGLDYLKWYLAYDRDAIHDNQEFIFGFYGDTPVAGDWNGNGLDKAGVVRKGSDGYLHWYLDTNGDGQPTPDNEYIYGFNSDIPVVGDWDGDGTDNIGIVRPGADGLLAWYLDTNWAADGKWEHEIAWSFGLVATHDVPIVGDWNGDGKSEAGVVRDEGGKGLHWLFNTDAANDKWAETDAYTSGMGIPVTGRWTMPKTTLFVGDLSSRQSVANGGTLTFSARQAAEDPVGQLPFHLLNPGTAPLNVTSISVTGNGFELTGQTSGVIGPSGAADFTVRYTGIGDPAGQLTILTNDKAASPYVIHFAVAPVVPVVEHKPILAVAVRGWSEMPDPVPIGPGQLNSPRPPEVTFVLSNTGDQPLSFGTITFGTITPPNGFRITKNLSGTTLVPGATATLVVQLDVTSEGVKSGSLRIPSNDQGNPASVFSIPVSGTVKPVPQQSPVISVYEDRYNGTRVVNGGSQTVKFPPAMEGTEGTTRHFVIHNSGPGTLFLGPLTIGPTVYSDGSQDTAFVVPLGQNIPAGTALATGQEVSFEIRLDPHRHGLPETAKVSFVTNDPAASAFSFLIVGTIEHPAPPPAPGPDPPSGSKEIHYLTFGDRSGNIQGTRGAMVTYTPKSIIQLTIYEGEHYYEYEYTKFFDGDASGIYGNVYINDFDILPDGGIVFAFSGGTALRGRDGQDEYVYPSDLVVFRNGRWDWYLHSYKLFSLHIESVAVSENGTIYLSLEEPGFSMPIYGSWYDLLSYRPSDQTWSKVFDGSQNNLFELNELIDAVDVYRGDFYFSTKSFFTVGENGLNLSGQGSDVIAFTPQGMAGTWHSKKVLDASPLGYNQLYGFPSDRLEGYDYGGVVPAGPPAVSTSSIRPEVRDFNTSAVIVQFDKPLDFRALDRSGVTLSGTVPPSGPSAAPALAMADSNSGSLTVSDVFLADDRTVVVLTDGPITSARVRLEFAPSIIVGTDGGTPTAPIVLDFDSWDANAVRWIGQSGNWTDAANWSSGAVPGKDDNVLIDNLDAELVITIPSGSQEIKGLICEESLVLAGGSLKVHGDSVVAGPFTMQPGTTLTSDGPAASFTTTGQTQINSAGLYATGSGKLSLPGVTSYAQTRAATWHVEGAGSVLSLPDLQSITFSASALVIEAVSGGRISLPQLQQVTD